MSCAIMVYMLAYILISAFVVMTASLSGAIFIIYRKDNWITKNSHYLVTFSAGVFSVVSYGLLTESYDRGGTPFLIFVSLVSGAIILEMLGYLFISKHHHHSVTHSHTHTLHDAHRVMLGASFHDSLHGLFLPPAFALSIKLGIATTIALFIHEAVQGMSKFFILKEAGYSTVRALTLNFIVSATIFIGIVVGLLIEGITAFVPYFLALVAGAFIFVVVRDLLPSTLRNIRNEKNASKHIISGLLGGLIVFIVGTLVFLWLGV